MTVNEALERALETEAGLIVGADELKGILDDTDMPQEDRTAIGEEYRRDIQPGIRAEWLLNSKALKRAEELKKRKEINKLMLTAADAILHPNIDEEYATKLVEKLRRIAER